MPSLKHEHELWREGYTTIAGIDEAGRGAWAGVVVAAAVVLPKDNAATTLLLNAGVNDSKKLSASRRNILRSLIQKHAAAFAICHATAQEIDTLGILVATRLAMFRCIESLPIRPTALLIDAVKLRDINIHQRVFNFADSISLSVAAASVLAKTERDAMMQALDTPYPAYGFGTHKGYGTKRHQLALQTHGICAEHRQSFKPIKNVLPT